jgi:putative protein-disulfide isomerase
MQFLYIMDPMCSWCYAFQAELEPFFEKHATIDTQWIMGGLAPDNDQPMDEELKQTISTYWQQIESKTQVAFNQDFWEKNTPIRSTYPACRSVIAAETLAPNSAQKMVKAIQSAYYQKAKNPAIEETLIDCAVSIGFDKEQFTATLKSEETNMQLYQHMGISKQLEVTGFPALFYIHEGSQAYALSLGFCTYDELNHRMEHIQKLLAEQSLST